MDKADAKMAAASGVCFIGFGTDIGIADIQSNLAVLVGGFINNMVDGTVLGKGFSHSHQLVWQEIGIDGYSDINCIYHRDVLFVATVGMVVVLCVLIGVVYG